MSNRDYIMIAGVLAIIGLVFFSYYSRHFSLDRIKSRTVGDGQFGASRWATKKEIDETYLQVPFEPELWRTGKQRPTAQGLVLGCEMKKDKVIALVETGDVHALMTAASGAGKTAYFLYPNIEYALATGMSFLCTDTKGDLFRNYAGIAKKDYGYNVVIIDLRNPTRSDGDNILSLVNKYMDEYLEDHKRLDAKAKAEKHAKILANTLIKSDANGDYGQNQYFYDAAEGLLAAMILLVAEFIPADQRHIVSVYNLVQQLVGPSAVAGKTQFQLLMELLPPKHKAFWLAGAALEASEQAMGSILSTVLSRLNSFLDSEMEQLLCFETAIDAEKFSKEKSALFIVLPEEDATKYFMASLIIEQLYRELLIEADKYGGRLPNRVVFFADELGTCPPINSIEMMFSAGRSRGLMLVPIVQSISGQLRKNYGQEGTEIILENCQVNIFGGFAPGSQTAEQLSGFLGNRTVMSGSVTQDSNTHSQNLQMTARPLMTADELKTLPKGHFIVMKTGVHPMQVHLRLFLEWGIRFGEPYQVEEKAQRVVPCADKTVLIHAIRERYSRRPTHEESDSPKKEPQSIQINQKFKP